MNIRQALSAFCASINLPLLTPKRRGTRAFFSALESLEPRTLFTFTSSLAILTGGKSATFTDLDGDHVTVAITIGTLSSANFVMSTPSNLHDQLQTLDFTGTSSTYTGTAVKITVVKAGSGDGLTNVGFINATGVDLGAVTLTGDLGRINAGDANAATSALASLSVRTMGRLGTDSQAVSGNLQSIIVGSMGALTSKGDLKDVQITVQNGGNTTSGNIASITIGGSLIGGAGDHSGSIHSDGSTGLTKISGDVIGGAGGSSGSIIPGTSCAGVTVGGSVIAGNGASSGCLYTNNGPMGNMTIGGDVIGGYGQFSGYIGSYHSSVGNITIGGSLIGGTGQRTGVVRAPVTLGAVNIAGDVVPNAADIENGSIIAGSIASVTVGGSLKAWLQANTLGPIKVAGDASGPIISFGSISDVTIGGSLNGSMSASTTIGKISVAHDANSLIQDNGNAITSVTIGGSLHGTITSAGAIPSVKIGHDLAGSLAANSFGTLTIAGRVTGTISAATNITSISAGALLGSLAANLTLSKAKFTGDVAGSIFANNAGTLTIGGVTGSVFMNQTLGTTTISGDVTGGLTAQNLNNVSVLGSVIGGNANYSGRIYASVSLGQIKVSGDADRGNGNLAGIISGGAIGTVTILGALSSRVTSLSSLGTLTVGGDVTGAIYANGGNLESLTVGGSLIYTGGPNSGQLQVNGNLGTLKVGGDIRFIRFGAHALGTATIHGSLLGQGNDSGIINIASIGTLTLGGDIRGGDGTDSGAILASHITSLTIGGSLRGGDGNQSGIVQTSGDIGSLTIKHNLVGGTSTQSAMLVQSGFINAGGRIGSITISGSIFAGQSAGLGTSQTGAIAAANDIGSLTVKGSIVGNQNGTNPVNTVLITARGQAVQGASTDLAIGTLTVGGHVEFANILAGFTPNLTAVNGDAQIGAVTVSGDWIASSLIAGAQNTASSNTSFGDGNDTSIGAGNSSIVASIASIKISGTVFGTPLSFSSTDHFGFIAQKISSLSINGATLPLTVNLDTLNLSPTGDVTALEVP